jgi:hypothetical protein
MFFGHFQNFGVSGRQEHGRSFHFRFSARYTKTKMNICQSAKNEAGLNTGYLNGLGRQRRAAILAFCGGLIFNLQTTGRKFSDNCVGIGDSGSS